MIINITAILRHTLFNNFKYCNHSFLRWNQSIHLLFQLLIYENNEIEKKE
jgi:hypothetical protein